MKRKYNIVFEKDVIVINLLGISFLVLLGMINTIFDNHSVLMIIFNLLMVVAACIYSYRKLNRYMGVDVITSIRNKIGIKK